MIARLLLQFNRDTYVTIRCGQLNVELYAIERFLSPFNGDTYKCHHKMRTGQLNVEL